MLAKNAKQVVPALLEMDPAAIVSRKGNLVHGAAHPILQRNGTANSKSSLPNARYVAHSILRHVNDLMQTNAMMMEALTKLANLGHIPYIAPPAEGQQIDLAALLSALGVKRDGVIPTHKVEAEDSNSTTPAESTGSTESNFNAEPIPNGPESTVQIGIAKPQPAQSKQQDEPSFMVATPAVVPFSQLPTPPEDLQSQSPSNSGPDNGHPASSPAQTLPYQQSNGPVSTDPWFSPAQSVQYHQQNWPVREEFRFTPHLYQSEPDYSILGLTDQDVAPVQEPSFYEFPPAFQSNANFDAMLPQADYGPEETLF